MTLKLPRPGSAPEELLALMLRTDPDIPPVTREHRFHKTRMWRFDFAWPDIRLAIEIDGLTHGAGGRHQRFAGFEADTEKLNEAILGGWRVLRFTPKAVRRGVALPFIHRALQLPPIS